MGILSVVTGRSYSYLGQLREQLIAAKQDMECSYQLFKLYEERYEQIKKEYEAADYKNAITDGRCKVVRGQKTQKNPLEGLTEGQILAIARELNDELNEQ